MFQCEKLLPSGLPWGTVTLIVCVPGVSPLRGIISGSETAPDTIPARNSGTDIRLCFLTLLYQVGHAVKNIGRPVRKLVNCLQRGYTGQHQEGVYLRLYPGNDVRIHSVAYDHSLFI